MMMSVKRSQYEVYVIFDKYHVGSMKTHERTRRAGKRRIHIMTLPSTRRCHPHYEKQRKQAKANQVLVC